MLISLKITCPLWFCRYNSLSLLHQPSWNQKDDFGQKWVHQSYPPSEERCGSRHEHGHRRNLLVWHLPKEDLQVSKTEIRMKVMFLFLLPLPDATPPLSIQSSDGLGWRLHSAQHSHRQRRWCSWRHRFWLDPWEPVLDWQHPQHRLRGNRWWQPPQNSLPPRLI